MIGKLTFSRSKGDEVLLGGQVVNQVQRNVIVKQAYSFNFDILSYFFLINTDNISKRNKIK